MATDLYSRDEFIAHWASVMKAPAEPYALAVTLINKNRNYQTAMALIFGLSWVHHKEYLQRVCKYFEANWSAEDVANVEWLTAFVDHYVTEVEKYPEDA